jgi:rhamnogalacturonan endolyase
MPAGGADSSANGANADAGDGPARPDGGGLDGGSANPDGGTLSDGGEVPGEDGGPQTPVGRCGTKPSSAQGKLQLESLCRGVVAVRAGQGNFVSWRVLGYEGADVTYNLYRDGAKLNATPLTVSNYVDADAPATAQYTVKSLAASVESEASEVALTWQTNYLDIALETTADYRPGDTSVGDLDGDGEYELVVKEEQMGFDPSQDGVTGQPKYAAYELDGTLMWRVDLGVNIREGEHTTPFVVYDLDGDGAAELMVKTAPGTKDGKGAFLSKGPAASDDDAADFRSDKGRILTGNEYISVFSGRDGAELDTLAYEPARGKITDWGDDYGNRSDRQNATIAFLDGSRPSAVFQRGYYAKTALAAYDYRDGKLSLRWKFDTANAGSEAYAGKGVHSIMAADVDGDLRQEIVLGGATISADGKGLCTVPFYAHGDAIHVGDLLPARPGLEVFQPYEGSGAIPAYAMRDADTCEILWKGPDNGANEGPGRGVAGDISPDTEGAEAWTNAVGAFNGTTGAAAGAKPSSANFLVWWDGDESRELLNGNAVINYDKEGQGFTATGCSSINGSKSVPNLSADLIGDWREEVILTCDGKLRIYTTDQPTTRRIYTLMHDPQYRVQVSSQNATYNQPPHTSFHIGAGMKEPPLPNIFVR